MDRQEAARLLRHELSRYATRSRVDLVGLIGSVDAYPVEGPTGALYQVEIDAHWDTEPGGIIRVLGSIDDGGLRSAFSPVTDDFLVGIDGSIDPADAEDAG